MATMVVTSGSWPTEELEESDLMFEGAACTSRLPLDFQSLGGLLDRTERSPSFVASLVGSGSRFGVDGSDKAL